MNVVRKKWGKLPILVKTYTWFRCTIHCQNDIYLILILKDQLLSNTRNYLRDWQWHLVAEVSYLSADKDVIFWWEKHLFHAFGTICIRMLIRANESALKGEFDGWRIVLTCVWQCMNNILDMFSCETLAHFERPDSRHLLYFYFLCLTGIDFAIWLWKHEYCSVSAL